MGTDPAPVPTRGPTLRGNRATPIIDHAPLPVIAVQGAGHTVSYVNDAVCRLLGKSRHELVGNAFAEVVPGGNACVPTLNQVYETGRVAIVTPGVDSEPDFSQWLYAMWPALDGNERAIGVIIQMTQANDFRQNATAINEALLISGLHQHELTEEAVKLNAQLEIEIIERRLTEAALQAANNRLADQAGELEQLVAERTAKLRETVGELEGFSYSVAHDMRAPLRGMQGFARILLDEHSSQLDATAHSYLERIAGSAARMDSLIQDVLNYTRVLRADALLSTVDLDRLVRDIISTYPGWQEPDVKIVIEGKLPLVLGHEGFLTQCVSNVMSNAVKFVAPKTIPHVRIWSEDRAASPTQAPWPGDRGRAAAGWMTDGPIVRVWFEDNGIGIAPKDCDRIFRMFERINAADKFEGTGIGLTIVRKALERMGGRIGFESVPGKGSQFWFELKKAPVPQETAVDAV